MTPLESKIQSIIDEMHGVFRVAAGPRDRAEYMRENNIKGGIDWSISLSSDDIINQKIPAPVAGCTGRAKLFCKLAAAQGLPCYVVLTANYDNWTRARDGQANIINGHQIIAVDIDGRLRAFDPGRKRLAWIDADVAVGHFIDVIKNQRPYLVTAIVPGTDFETCNTYKKLRNLYASGDIDNAEFMINSCES